MEDPNAIVVEAKDETKQFRIQSKWLALTYKGHIDKERLRSFLAAAWPMIKMKRCEIAHETGQNDPTMPYEHTHVGVEYERAVQSRDPRKLDFDNVHPFIGTSRGAIKNGKMWRDWLTYIAKEDESLSHILEETTPIATVVWSKNSIQEVCEMARTPSEVMGLVKLYEYKNNKIPDPFMENWKPWGWQPLVYETIMMEAPDERSIWWLSESKGSCGKTKFCKWLMYHMPEYFLCMEGLGFTKDVVQIIGNGVKAGWRGHCIVINLVRSFENKEFIYETLEALKDGMHMQTKYDGRVFMTPCPTIVVFANWHPKKYNAVGQPTLSLDRWREVEIIPEGEDPNEYPTGFDTPPPLESVGIAAAAHEATGPNPLQEAMGPLTPSRAN